MEDIEIMKRYIEYLKEHAELSVSLHFHMATKTVFGEIINEKNAHNHPYCAYVKQIPEVHWECLNCQRKAAAKCRKEGDFAGVCHAGVFEYVYPVTLNGKKEGVLCVGGYATENGHSYIDALCKKYELDRRMLKTAYNILEKNVPPKKEVDTLIFPLLSMLELYSYKQTLKKVPNEPLSDQILWYCNSNYLNKITSESICRRFFCSRSYVAHMFKKETGKSLPEYINHLRVESAKNMLENSNIQVAEIAGLSGFEERAYFSKCFKQITGVSPRTWRQMHKK